MNDIKYTPIECIPAGAVIESITWDGECDVLIKHSEGQCFLRGELDCCAYIGLVSTGGDPQALIGATVVSAEEAYWEAEQDYGDTETHAFARIVTDRADLCLAWDGGHNGYYCAYISASNGYYPSFYTEADLADPRPWSRWTALGEK